MDVSDKVGSELRDFNDWMNDATVCRVGQYTVYAPAAGNRSEIVVMRGREVILSREPGSSMMFLGGTDVSVSDGSKPGDHPWLSYGVRDSTGVSMTVFDRNLDGQPDLRIHYARGQKLRRERWIDGRWVDLIVQDGRNGFLRDGQFVPLEGEQVETPGTRHGQQSPHP